MFGAAVNIRLDSCAFDMLLNLLHQLADILFADAFSQSHLIHQIIISPSNGNKSQEKNQEEEKLSWLRQILEWQKDMSDNREFLSLLKSDLDLFADTVFCFTPSGDVKNLPNGSSPIDFAYSIHSAVGNKMIGAKVNGRLVNISSGLRFHIPPYGAFQRCVFVFQRAGR